MTGYKRQEFFNKLNGEFNDIANRLRDAADRHNPTELYMFFADAIRCAGLNYFGRTRQHGCPNHIQQLKKDQQQALLDRGQVRDELQQTMPMICRLETLTFYYIYTDEGQATKAEQEQFLRAVFLFLGNTDAPRCQGQKSSRSQQTIHQCNERMETQQHAKILQKTTHEVCLARSEESARNAQRLQKKMGKLPNHKSTRNGTNQSIVATTLSQRRMVS